MQFTLRQGFSALPALVLWVLVSALCAISGPFGTLEEMGPLARLIYWSAVVGLSILGALMIERMQPKAGWPRIIVWALYAIVIAGAVYLFNAAFFGAEAQTGNFAYLAAIVSTTVLVIHGLLWLAHRTLAAVPAASHEALDAAARFQRRLPLEVRGPLVRIEAQDHYLNVITTNGNVLILMRLSEAVEELAGVNGLQTHRSHWVNVEAIKSHRRNDGRDILMMSDGAEIPVARTRRAAVKAAGLF